ncbi:MAG TPA: prolyl oligopeptidase family serine peptidase [Geminicoccaceae bacterium]
MTLLSGPRVPPRAGGPPRQLIVLLHGVGANGDDLIALAPALAAALPGAAFVAPNAPEPYDMAPFGYQWFSMRDRRPDTLLLGVQAAAPLVDAFLDAELERYRLADHQLALLGFSQGTMTALHVAPRRPRAVAGVLGYSGALLGTDRLAQEAISRPPVFLIHGDADEVLPVHAMYAAVAALQAAGIPAQWSLRRGLSHGIEPDSIAHGAAFLAAAFASGA